MRRDGPESPSERRWARQCPAARRRETALLRAFSGRCRPSPVFWYQPDGRNRRM